MPSEDIGPALLPHKGVLQLGHCNICRSFGPLTDDHVPPKGTRQVGKVDLLPIAQALQLEPLRSRRGARKFQNGVYFRSICAECNNSRLGATYDPELIKFSNAVSQIYAAKHVRLPLEVNIRCRPGLIARSVLGHLLAIGVNRTERTPALDAIRAFVVDVTKPLPEEIDIHYWPYPFQPQVQIRDAVLLDDFFSKQIVFWCLKYNPVGFIVTFDNKHPELVQQPNLRDVMLHAGLHEADIPLRLYGVPPAHWPEAPSETGAIGYGDGACFAIPSIPRRPKSRR